MSDRREAIASVDAGRRTVYSHADLKSLIDPASIAVVGASPREGAFGERVVANLIDFTGRTYLVNPGYQRISDSLCYPDLAALPEVPDCVVVAVGSAQVEQVVAEAVRLGVGGVIVFASGFAETGKPDKIAVQQRLQALVAGTATRLAGPNCIGLCNQASHAQMSFTVVSAPPVLRRPAIGMVSQSGALGNALAQAMAHGVSISHILTAGNSCDVDIADMVSYLADDPNCDAIACMFEGLADPERLLAAARRAWANDKPVVVYKIATGVAGAAAALSHTAALAGSNAVYAAAFDSVGIVTVDAPEHLVETAMFFAKAPRAPLAEGAAILSVSGGAGIIAADKSEQQGIALPAFSAATEAMLTSILPDFGSPKNPCDMTAELLKKPEMLVACADAILSEPEVGALVYPHPFARDGATERMTILADAAKRHAKPFCTVWLTQWLEGPGATEVAQHPDAILFRSMDRCFATLGAWHRRARQRLASAATPAPLVAATHRVRVAHAIAANPDAVIGEATAKAMLADYGIPVVPERLVTTLTEARSAGEALGYPLAVKVESPDIPHKTEAGLVFLNVDSCAALESAFQTIVDRVAEMAPRPRLNGIVVQPMVPQGLELLIGGRVDPLFGPLVVFGFGGTLVELLNDSVIALAPVSAQQATAMLPRLAGHGLLAGFRGAPTVDIDALGAIIARVSEFISDNRASVAELDINPLIATVNGLVAVDALIVRRDGVPAAAERVSKAA